MPGPALLGGLVVFGLIGPPGASPGPGPSPPAGQGGAVLRGEVRLAGEGLPGAEVILHQVAVHTAGEVDTTRTDRAGRFRFRLPAPLDPERRDAIYFASVRYRGILYFGPALTAPDQLDSAYVIQVYDTAVAPAGGASLPVEMRHLILEGAGEGWTVTDMVQLRHGGDRTLVAREEGITWSYPLPRGATDFQVGQSDLAPDAVELREGELRLSAPIPPGNRLYVFRYRVPGREVELPLRGITERVELLVREPAPEVAAVGLEAAAPVELEGERYRRFVGAGLRDATVRLERREPPLGVPSAWIAGAAAVLLALGVLLGLRRGRAGASPAPAGSPGREALILEIARLDEEFARRKDPDPEEREAYRRRREALKARLRGLGGG